MLKYSYDASGNLLIQAQDNLLPPQVTGQPVKQIAAPGDIVTFSVVVADARAVTFQWKFNGTDIPGATGDSLLLTSVSAVNEGQYSVVVTNSTGSVTSTPAALLLDSNGNGLPDSWEIAHFGNLTSQRSAGDADGDGVSNLDEFLDGTDPTDKGSLRPRLIAYGDTGGVVTVVPMHLSYALGETVTLTATPFTPSVFVGWTGDLIGTSNPATLTLNGNKTVRARFISAIPLPPGLVAFWRGEPTEGSVVVPDIIGGHDGGFFIGNTPTSPSYAPDGKVGSAFRFDGTVYVRVPDSAALKPTQITLEAWVFPTVLSGTLQTIIARGFTWNLGVFNGKPRFTHRVKGIQLDGPSAIPLNEWTHLAASFDGMTKQLYINGAQVAVQTTGEMLYDVEVPVTIGSAWTSGASTDLFNGRIDEVALYNRALTADEVAGIYNADFVGKNVTQPYFTSLPQLPTVALGAKYSQQVLTVLGTSPVSFSLSIEALPPGMALSSTGIVSGVPSTEGTFGFTVRATDALGTSTEQLCELRVAASVTAPAGLVSWWRAENNAQDSVGTNHGMLRNGADFAAGQVGQAFALDGIDDCIEIPDAPSLRPVSVTLEAWVAIDAPSVTGFQFVFAKTLGINTSDSYGLWLQGNSVLGIVCDAAGRDTITSDPFSLVYGRWYHVAYTFDDGSKQQVLYVDGSPVAHQTATRSIGYDAQPLLLGRDTKNSIPNFFLHGRIDEAAIYNRALSDAEIASIFNAGPAGKRL